MKRIFLIILIILTATKLLWAKGEDSYFTGILSGETSVCITTEYDYQAQPAAFPADADNCPVFYDWEVIGGTIVGRSASTLNRSTRITIKWDNITGTKSVKLAATNRFQTAEGDGDACSTTVDGAFSISNQLSITEGSCSGGGSTGGGTTRPVISDPIMRSINAADDYLGELRPSNSIYCSGEYNIWYLLGNGDSDVNNLKWTLEISLGDNQSYVQISERPFVVEQLGNYPAFNFDDLINGQVSTVYIRGRIIDGLGRVLATSEVFHQVLPLIEVAVESVNPPVCDSNDDDASVDFVLLSENTGYVTATIERVYESSDDICSEADAVIETIQVTRPGSEPETVDICLARGPSATAQTTTVMVDENGSFSLGPEANVDYYDPVDDQIKTKSLSLGTGLYKFQIVASNELGEDSEFSCPSEFYFRIPAPSVLQVPMLNDGGTTFTAACVNDKVNITGSIAYDLAYTNNPDVMFYLYNGTTEVADTIITLNADDSTASFNFEVTSAGIYKVKAKKAPCSVTAATPLTVSTSSYTINYPTAIAVSDFTPTDETCFDSNDGTISFSISGGTPPYRLTDISNLIGVSKTNFGDTTNIGLNQTFYITDLAPRTNISGWFKVEDYNGCITQDSVLFNVDVAEKYEVDTASTSYAYEKCLSAEYGVLTVEGTGGTGSYNLEFISGKYTDGTDIPATIESGASRVVGMTIKLPANCTAKFKVKDAISGNCESDTLNIQIAPNNNAFNIASQTIIKGTCNNDLGTVKLKLVNVTGGLGTVVRELKYADNTPVSSVFFSQSATGDTLVINDLPPGNNYKLQLINDGCTLNIGNSPKAGFYIENPVEFALSNKTYGANYNTLANKLICYDDETEVSFDIAVDSLISFIRLSRGDTVLRTTTAADITNGVYNTGLLGAGTYTLSGQDDKGCEMTMTEETFTIGQTSSRLAISNITPIIKYTSGQDYHITNYGDADGVISVVATGGQRDYSFQLLAGNTVIDSYSAVANVDSVSFDSLSANIDYRVVITDSLGCTDTSNIIPLIQPDLLILNDSLSNYLGGVNIKCDGGTDKLYVSATGGIAQYRVELFNALDDTFTDSVRIEADGEEMSFEEVSAGFYYLRLIDKLGISAIHSDTVISTTFEIKAPAPLTVDTASTTPSCTYSDDGTFTVTPSGGTKINASDYTITFYDAVKGFIKAEMAASSILVADSGDYYYTVEDALGCTYSDTATTIDGYNPFSIVNHPVLGIDTVYSTYPLCYGDTTATLTAEVARGRTGDGTYEVALYDSLNNELRTITDTNGKAVFYSLFAGNYRLVAYDSSGCVDTANYYLPERTDRLAFTQITSIASTCANSDNAKVAVISQGGDTPHQYSIDSRNTWQIADSTAVIDSVTYYFITFDSLESGGNYEVWLKDDNYKSTSYNEACLVSDTISISVTPLLGLSIQTQNVSCFGLSDGQVEFFPTFGSNTNPNNFTFEVLQDGEIIRQGESEVYDLPAGDYKVRLSIKDPNSCPTNLILDFTIFQPPVFDIELYAISTFNCNDSSALINIKGELFGGNTTQSYQYAINEGSFNSLSLTNNTFEVNAGLEAKNHWFYIKQIGGCIDSVQFTVHYRSPGITLLDNQKVNCYGSLSGKLVFASAMGTLDYQLVNLLTNDTITLGAQDTAVFDQLAASDYRVMANTGSCVANTMDVSIQTVEEIALTINTIEPASCGQSNGSIAVSMTGGSGAYDITVLKSGLGQIMEEDALPAGDYQLFVRDTLGCQVDTIFSIEEVNAIQANVSKTVPSCGKDNGKITLSVSNAIDPLEILWFNSAKQQIAKGLTVSELGNGTYFYKVTDQTTCFVEDSVSLYGNEPLVASIQSFSAAACGIANGRATIIITGGVAPYQINWPAGPIVGTDQFSATGLSGGALYEVEIQDAAACNTSLAVVVPNEEGPNFSFEKSLPYCGENNGAIRLTALSGKTPFTYQWIDYASDSATLSQIGEGTYQVIVTDIDGCSTVGTVTLDTDYTKQLALDYTVVDESCTSMDGSISLSISGGFTPYTVEWEGLPTTATELIDLAPGNYTAIVTDSMGCSEIANITVDSYDKLALSPTAFEQPSCGEANGFIELQPLGNNYGYKWSHNENLNASVADSLVSGLYQVFAYTATGCNSDTLSFFLSNQSSGITIQTTNIIGAACSNSADGSIAVAAQGGTAPFTYEWDDALQQSGQTASGLSPGVYTVKVTDATSCTAYKSVTLNAINPVYIVAINAQEPSCASATDGRLSVEVAGGKGSYTYLWSTGATTQSIDNITAGTYTVEVFDNGICSDVGSIELQAPATLDVEAVTTTPSCYTTADGSAVLNAAGGTAPYVYQWEDGTIAFRRFDLTAGAHALRIIDAANCLLDTIITIQEKTAVTLNATISPVKCFGGKNGGISISNIQNANNALLRWSNGQIGNRLVNVSAGTYTLTVEDAAGCNSTFDYVIEEPAPLAFNNEVVNDINCFGEKSGNISFDISGGSGNYTFKWNDGSSAQNRAGLASGNYRVVVTDENACSMAKTFTIKMPDAISWTIDQAMASCFNGNDAEATINVVGGMAPYVVTWNDGTEASSRNDLSAGRYSFVVTDSVGCQKAGELTLTNPAIIRIESSNKFSPSCAQAADGSITVNASGGTGTLSYLWSTGDTTATAANLSAGTYSITITDSNGCTFNQSILLNDASPISISQLVTTNPICYGEASGTAIITPNGGSAPYTVIWQDGNDGLSRTDLLAGTHEFTISDANGCSKSYEITLSDPALEQLSNLPSIIYLCEGGVTVLDAGDWDTYQWTADNGFSSTDRRATIDAAGNYLIEVSNNAGCIDSHEIEVIKDADLLKADFLLTSEAVVGDTVLIIDISWPMPDSVRWINPKDNDFYLVNQTIEYQEVIFTRTGDFTLAMKANLDLCEAYVEKTIKVLSREEAARIAEEKAKSGDHVLHLSTNIYPNPNHGIFRLEVEGSQEHDVSIRIVDLHKGIEYYQMKGNKQLKHVFNVQNSSMHPGVYIAIIEADEQIITKRFVIK